MATCIGCGAKIDRIKMKPGKSMPVDIKKQTFIVTTPPQGLGEAVQGLVPHWSTCPAGYRKVPKGR